MCVTHLLLLLPLLLRTRWRGGSGSDATFLFLRPWLDSLRRKMIRSLLSLPKKPFIRCVISCVRRGDGPTDCACSDDDDGPERRISTSLLPSSESAAALSSDLIGCPLASLERLTGREGTTADTGADVPISVFFSSSSSFAGDTDSRFLFVSPRCCACAALVWRVNIASIPSLRFWTGSMNVGDSVPTFPTSLGTA